MKRRGPVGRSSQSQRSIVASAASVSWSHPTTKHGSRAIAGWGLGVAAVLTCLAAGTKTAAAQTPDPDFEQLLARAAAYVADFVDRFSNVVAEEQYIQDSSVALPTVPIPGLGGGRAVPRTSARHRELKSDFLVVKSAGEDLQPFRDVFEVDHVPIRDREERLARLFLGKHDATVEARAKEIADESARYNLGAVERTINNPIFALTFLQPDVRARSTFSLRKPDRQATDGIRVVEFVEQTRPTLIKGRQGQDMPAHGRFWIEVETGRVVKAEVRVDQTDVKAVLTAEFRAEGRLGIDVPFEMREDYDLVGSRVTGRATYGRFRRFEVQSTEEVAPPAKPTAPPQ